LLVTVFVIASEAKQSNPDRTSTGDEATTIADAGAAFVIIGLVRLRGRSLVPGEGPVIPMNWASRFEYRDGRNMSGHDRDTSHDLSAVVPAQSLAVILASGSAQAHARKVHVQP